MKWSVYPNNLQFRFPFKIAHTARSYTANVYLHLQHHNSSAWGEAAFPPYVKENLDTFNQLIKQVDWPQNVKNLEIDNYIAALDKRFPQNPFSLAAIDIALHNLQQKESGIPIKEKYAIPDVKKNTSFTLGISTEEEIKENLKLFNDVRYIKLKVDQDQIDRMVNTFRRFSSKPFVIDANQGFTSPDLALQWCNKLYDMGCQYLEQPFEKQNLDKHQWLKSRSKIPIIADESFQRLNELEAISKNFHGINVKLMKCSGIAEAYKILIKTKELGLKTVLGCMSESSVAVGAAWNLAPLADWVDLDGPLLIKNDLFDPKLNYSDEQIISKLTTQLSL